MPDVAGSGGAGHPPQGNLPAGFHRAVLEHSPDLITVADAEGWIVFSTRTAAELLGYDPSERIGRSLFELVHPDDLEEQRENMKAFLESSGSVFEAEFRIRRADGEVRFVQGRGRNLLHDPRVAGLLLHLRDVTASRVAEQERDEARRNLDRVIAHAPVILFMVDKEGVFELSEGRGLEPLGLKPGEAVGRNVFEDFEWTEQGLNMIRRALAGEEAEEVTPFGELTYHTVVAPVRGADGEVQGALGVSFDVTEREREAERAEFRSRLLSSVGEAVMATDTDGVVKFWNRAAEQIYGWSAEEVMGRDIRALTDPRAVRPGRARVDLRNAPDRWAGEYSVRRKGGDRIPVYVTTVKIEAEGEPTTFVGVSTELTEMHALEDQLRQAQKMEAVGQLAGGVAHDFNNLLTAIGGYAAVAADAATDPAVAADIAEVVNATERARALVDKLLAFSRRSQTAPRPMDLNAVIEGLVGMLRRMIGEEVRLETKLAADLWPAFADSAQLEQAIVNLVVNARDAMPDGGTITVGTARVALDEERASRIREGMAPGDYVRLTVTDTGTGIAPDVLDRIFEPFFTTKEVGRGTGLGLSLVFGEVTRVGGGIEVQTAPGKGSTFAVYLPAVTGAAGVERAGVEGTGPAPPTGASGGTRHVGGETILLVEDEVSVRQLARRVLERAGYSVREAENGAAAERLLASLDAEPDLLLTDVIMPEMGGAELAERVALDRPDLRILYMSGYTADELRSRGLEESQENFLPKPFTPDQLKEAVRRVLST